MDLDAYLRMFAQIRVDKNKSRWTESTTYRAPHKPLLLLSILDLFAQGEILSNLIQLTPQLGNLFSSYWTKVMPAERRGNIALPFFHLRSSKFWHLKHRPEKEQELKNVSQVDTLTQLDRLILGASLDKDLYDLMQLEEARNAIRRVLVQTYFAPELHAILFAQGMVNYEIFQYSQQLIKHSRLESHENSAPYELEVNVRDKGFRQAIVSIYQHRCAFCGVRMMTPDGYSVTEAAHIIPWGFSHNDDIHNGIALCGLCHWTFDKGLVSINPNYLIILSRELHSSLNLAGHLLTLDHRSILGPEERDLWPDHEAIQWHRKNIYRE